MTQLLNADQLRASGVRHATVIGGGVIGASWAALFLASGLAVTVNDPDADIAAKVGALIADAAPALAGLGYQTNELTRRLSFESDLAAAIVKTDLVQECGPERLDFKRALWARIEAAAPLDALLLSSSSSIPASAQNAD